jgi:hypothetical protein
MKKYADIRIALTVSFDDNGDDALKDQAIEAAMDRLGVLSFHELDDIEVVGEVRDTGLPAKKGK